MTTEFAEIHDELRAVARDLLGTATPLVGDGGPPPPADWSALADVGWIGLEVPEHLGGSGATFAEVAVVLEEMGRAATVSPVLGTVVLGIGALLLAEPTEASDELLTRAASGTEQIATVIADGAIDALPSPSFALRAAPGGFQLDGRADLVPDVAGASSLLLVARDPAGTPVLVRVAPDSAGVAVAATPVLDATHELGSVVAHEALVPAGSVLRFAGDPVAAIGRLSDRAAVAVACDSLGLSRAMLDATVAYAIVRNQFGRAIGSFQAVKHACADMLVGITVAEELLRAAVDDLVGDDPQASVSASRAKAYGCETAVAVAGKAMQLHGGIGYAWESGVHVYLKRAMLDRSLFGSPVDHRRRVADALLIRVPGDPVAGLRGSGPPRAP